MNKFIRLICLILIFIYIIPFSGCWNYREVDNMYIVAGCALDYNDTHEKFILTVEVYDFQTSVNQTTHSELFSSEGFTLFDCLRNIIKVSNKKLYWGHMKVVIVSQDIAKDGIAKVTDWVLRDAEVRMEAAIFVSKEKTAMEILTSNTDKSHLTTANIEDNLNSQRSLSKSPTIRLYEYVQLLASEGITPTLPAVSIVNEGDKKTTSVAGAAIFKKDKLIGFISEDETFYYLFIRNYISGGVINDKISKNSKKPDISFEIFKSKTKMKPTIHDDKIKVDINIVTEASLAEYEANVDFSKNENLKLFSNHAATALSTKITSFIKKIQSKYNTDIFGFEHYLRHYRNSFWKTHKDKWDVIFPQIKATVTVDLIVKNSALTSKSIIIGE